MAKVREDGRATRIAYGEWGDCGDAGEGGEDGRRETGDASGDVRRETEDEGVIEGWGEIVAAVVGGEVPSQLSQWSQLSQSLVANFALAPGKSTREIRAVSARGDVIRRETFAYALGATEPRRLAHTTAAYSPTHNADGTLASNTGTIVTPEYHTYGVEVMDVDGNMVGRGVRTAPSGGDETGPGDTTVGRGLRSAPQPYPNGSSLPVGFGANGKLSTPVRVHEVRYGRADSPRFTCTYTETLRGQSLAVKPCGDSPSL